MSWVRTFAKSTGPVLLRQCLAFWLRLTVGINCATNEATIKGLWTASITIRMLAGPKGSHPEIGGGLYSRRIKTQPMSTYSRRDLPWCLCHGKVYPRTSHLRFRIIKFYSAVGDALFTGTRQDSEICASGTHGPTFDRAVRFGKRSRA